MATFRSPSGGSGCGAWLVWKGIPKIPKPSQTHLKSHPPSWYFLGFGAAGCLDSSMSFTWPVSILTNNDCAWTSSDTPPSLPRRRSYRGLWLYVSSKTWWEAPVVSWIRSDAVSKLGLRCFCFFCGVELLYGMRTSGHVILFGPYSKRKTNKNKKNTAETCRNSGVTDRNSVNIIECHRTVHTLPI